MSFVSFSVLSWGIRCQWASARRKVFWLCQGMASPLSLMWSEALYSLVNSEISVVYPKLGCKVHSALP